MMPDRSFIGAAGRRRVVRDVFLLAVFFGLLFGAQLGRAPLANPDESRYGEISREMLASGDWVTPTLDGVPYFEKPPLVYWALAGMMKILGPQELALRLVPAAFALVGVLLTYFAGRRLYEPSVGLAAALVLGTSLLYFALSQILLLDMAVAVLVSAALFCFILGVREPAGRSRRLWFYGLYLSAAFATLTKGLIGFLLPGAVMFLWLLVFKQWRRLIPFYLPSGMALFAAVAVPWHVAVATRNPGWAQFYFVHEHWLRFTTTIHGRHQPWWFFVPIVAVGLFPWLGFVASGLRAALAGGWARRKENADAWFLAIWAAFVFLFFSKSQSKLIPYILPVFPPLAVLAGVGLIAAVKSGRSRIGVHVFAGFCGLLVAALLVAATIRGVIRTPEQAAVLRPYAFTLAAVFACGAVAATWLMQRGMVRVVLGVMGATAVLANVLLSRVAPIVERPGTLALAEYVRAHAAPDEAVFLYRGFFHDFAFYARRDVGLIEFQDELELQFTPAAKRAARFPTEAELRSKLPMPTRLWIVARRADAVDCSRDFGLREISVPGSGDFVLLSNQPLAQTAPARR